MATKRTVKVSYWAATAAAIYFFISSAVCVAIIFGLVRGDRTNAELTAVLCFVLGATLLLFAHAIRVLLDDSQWTPRG